LAPRAKYADAQGAAGAVRQRHHAAHHLVGVTRIDAEIDRDLDRLVKLRLGAFLDHLDGVRDRIEFFSRLTPSRAFFKRFPIAMTVTPPTSRPIERAEPSTIFMADSMVSQFKSFIFFSAISRTCARVTLRPCRGPGPSTRTGFWRPA